MWHRADVVLTDFPEERIASIFRVEGKIRKSASEETVRTGGSRLLIFPSTLKMEAIRSPNRRLTRHLHGATSQKTAFFIVTTVKTSNLTLK
jgi:hypothetical protein